WSFGYHPPLSLAIPHPSCSRRKRTRKRSALVQPIHWRKPMKRITLALMFVGSILTMACSGTPLAPIRDLTGSQQVSSATSVLPTPSVLGKPMPSALAETTGDTTTFLVSAGISLTAGAANTIARYIGHPIGTARIQGCAADNAEYPVQVLLLVDPGSGTRAFQI